MVRDGDMTCRRQRPCTYLIQGVEGEGHSAPLYAPSDRARLSRGGVVRLERAAVYRSPAEHPNAVTVTRQLLRCIRSGIRYATVTQQPLRGSPARARPGPGPGLVAASKRGPRPARPERPVASLREEGVRLHSESRDPRQGARTAGRVHRVPGGEGRRARGGGVAAGVHGARDRQGGADGLPGARHDGPRLGQIHFLRGSCPQVYPSRPPHAPLTPPSRPPHAPLASLASFSRSGNGLPAESSEGRHVPSPSPLPL